MSDFILITTAGGAQCVIRRSLVKGTVPRHQEPTWFVKTETDNYIVSEEEAQRINALLLSSDTPAPSPALTLRPPLTTKEWGQKFNALLTDWHNAKLAFEYTNPASAQVVDFTYQALLTHTCYMESLPDDEKEAEIIVNLRTLRTVNWAKSDNRTVAFHEAEKYLDMLISRYINQPTADAALPDE
jgi:hypothetical protein